MTWNCPRCDTPYPDSGGSRGDGCLSCTTIVETSVLEDLLDSARGDLEDPHTPSDVKERLSEHVEQAEAALEVES